MNRNEPLSEKELENLRLHVAGATVRHENPFSTLPVPVNEAPLSQEIINKWVAPFYTPLYMRRLDVPSLRPVGIGEDPTPVHPRNVDARTFEFVAACAGATPELTLTLLAEFNWRPRVVGARFVAVRRFFELQQEISVLLLRSDVCFAGDGYCLALASLGNEGAADTLATYLGYYLTRRDLDYNQGFAMAALLYLDEALGSDRAQQFMEPWQRFSTDKALENFNKNFRETLGVIQAIQQVIARGESDVL